MKVTHPIVHFHLRHIPFLCPLWVFFGFLVCALKYMKKSDLAASTSAAESNSKSDLGPPRSAAIRQEKLKFNNIMSDLTDPRSVEIPQ